MRTKRNETKEEKKPKQLKFSVKCVSHIISINPHVVHCTPTSRPQRSIRGLYMYLYNVQTYGDKKS